MNHSNIRVGDSFHYLRLVWLLVRMTVDSPLCLVLGKLKGVTFGRKVKFVGYARFTRAPSSTIRVGDRVRFLSRFDSNLHGLHRVCSVSALSPGSAIEIGSECGLSGATICAAVSVKLGERVLVGANSLITDTDSHSTKYEERYPAHFGLNKDGWNERVHSRPIVVADDVWIGMNCMVLKGVTIGRGAVIGAGSVVTRDIPAHALASGNPARVIRMLSSDGQ